jgi:lipoyl(octanoyl) transferase
MFTRNSVICYTFKEQQPYLEMWSLQQQWVEEIGSGLRQEALLMLEHPHVFTCGRATHKEHLLTTPQELAQLGATLVEIDRGGDITYHGPGQLVGYPLLLLEGEEQDAHQYLRRLEEVIILTLKQFGLKGERKEAYTGVWVDSLKIAAIGVKFNRIKKRKGFVTSHGIALNVHTQLDMFKHIIPCGIAEYGVTSMNLLLGEMVVMGDVMDAFINQFRVVFNRPIHLKGCLDEKSSAH